MRSKVLLFSSVALLLILMVGCGGSTRVTQAPQPTRGSYVGADTCRTCHSDKYTEWSGTLHHGALDTLAAIHQDTNPICLACHTVGYGTPAGFVSTDKTPQLGGVQCENCHGGGGAHVQDPSGNEMEVTLSSSLCGACHTDVHHPTYEEFQRSRHAVALSSLRSLPYFTDECLECHSSDYRMAWEGLPTVRALAQYDIVCAYCHDPHSAENEGQLRKPVEETCTQCHNDQGVQPPEEPFASQAQMLAGTGGFNADGSPAVGPNAGHTAAITERCVECHLNHYVPGGTIGPDNPVQTGHTFQPDINLDGTITEAELNIACAPCHSGADALNELNEVQGEIRPRVEALGAWFDAHGTAYYDGLSPSDQNRYNIARFDYQFCDHEGSYGVHNHEYAEHLLDVAESIIETLPEAPPPPPL